MRRDKDLDRELETHVELDAEERRERGEDASAARQAARRELGNATQIKESVYEQHPLAAAERWWKDLRYAVRSLRRNPGFASVAVLLLALGIGSATAIFTIADKALLQALPVAAPDKLRLLNWNGEFIGGSSWGIYREVFSYPAFLELAQAQPEAFSGMAARYQSNVAIDAGAGAGRAIVEVVSGSYFDVLGVRATLGRTLSPEDDQDRDAEPWVVLSHDYWRDRFGADPQAVGKTVRINGIPLTIVGVGPAGFRGFDKLRPSDVFVPFQMNGTLNPTDDLRNRRDAIWLNIFARLAPGADARQAATALQIDYGGILRRDLEAHSRDAEKQATYVQNTLELVDARQGLQSIQREIAATPLEILSAMVGLLLLIVCINVANLLMVRVAKREKEIALRSSLGASRAAVVRLVLLESLLLSAAGSALGLLAARFGAAGLVRLVPADIGIRFDGSPDWRVAAFAAALGLLTALAFGLVPALQTTRAAAATALKNEAASVSLGRSQTRTRQALIVIQVALSLMLLAVAGLFGKSLSAIFEADSGFAVDKLAAFSLVPSEQNYDAERIRRLAVDLRDRLQRLPGVESASAATVPILAGGGPQNTIAAEGYQPEKSENMQAYANHVLPGFFSTVGVNVVAGRDFSERDVLGSPLVVIVNQAFADRFFGSPLQALGRHTGFGLGRVLPYEVIGVVADHKGTTMREQAFPRTYWPLLQRESHDHVAFYLSTRGNAESLLAGALSAVREFDPELAAFRAKTVTRQLEETHFIERMFAQLSAVFAVLATLIAAIGLYGIAAFAVARRTREIGVRIALGAQCSGVFKMVMNEALGLALVGALIGLPLALGVGKLVEAQLYGVAAIDPAVTIAATLALLAASALAGYLPARRAMRISPVQALRHD